MIHGRHDGHHPHHPHHNKTVEEGPMGPKYVTEDQFELYDTLRTVSSIGFFIFAKVMAIGKCGKWMAWSNKSKTTKWLGKKSCLGFVFVILMSLYAMHEHHHVKMIMKRVHHNPHHHRGDEGRQINMTLENPIENMEAERQIENLTFNQEQPKSQNNVEPKIETVYDRWIQSMIKGKSHHEGRAHHQREFDTSEEEHSKGGKHYGKFGKRRHHKKGCCKIVKLLLVALFGAHFFLVRRFMQE
jgi:hypothetical protein